MYSVNFVINIEAFISLEQHKATSSLTSGICVKNIDETTAANNSLATSYLSKNQKLKNLQILMKFYKKILKMNMSTRFQNTINMT